MFVFAKVLMLHKLIILFLPIIASSSVPKFFIMNEKIDTTNSSNITANCHPKIAESASKLIFELMSDKVTHVIDLHIWSESVNNTRSKSRVLTGVKWANEIGRTLITLITLAEKYDMIMLLSYTSTMNAGTHGLNIVAAEEAMRCFSLKENSSDNVLFDFLVYQLHHISGSNGDHNYKLCHPHNDKYNCCTIIGPNDSLICSDYSSILIERFPIIFFLTIIFTFYVLFPATANYFRQFDDAHYKISKSPMSLSSVLYSLFIEGHGPVKSSGRRLTYAFFVIVTTLPEYGSLQFIFYWILAGPWLIFLLIGKFDFDEKLLSESFFDTFKDITLPFNVKELGGRVLNWLRISQKYQVHPIGSSHQQLGYGEIAMNRVVFLLTLVCYLFIFLPGTLIKSMYVLLRDTILFFTLVVSSNSKHDGCKCTCCVWLFIIVTYLAFIYSMVNLFQLVFYFIIGLFLNGEIYNPYILPLCTILFYSWTNWRSSVETKYLVLITTIYEVCEEAEVSSASSNENSSDDISFTIQLDKDGELAIEKELYNSVREKFLPYDRVLFNYFQGVLFVVIFGYVLYILMSLAQESAISGSVQIIGSIAATSLPFIFDTVWKKNSDEQKEADTISLKLILKRILLVRTRRRKTRQMVVKLALDKYEKVQTRECSVNACVHDDDDDQLINVEDLNTKTGIESIMMNDMGNALF